MKHTKDLSWLSAPAFFLIVGMIVLQIKKPVRDTQEKVKTALTVPTQDK